MHVAKKYTSVISYEAKTKQTLVLFKDMSIFDKIMSIIKGIVEFRIVVPWQKNK